MTQRCERDRRSAGARDAELKSLGFATWDEYLASPVHAETARRALRARPLCECCLSPATTVHFYSYRRDVLAGRDLDRVASVCGGCVAESRRRGSDGARLSESQASAKLRQMVTLGRKSAAPGSPPARPAAPRVASPSIDPPFVPGSSPFRTEAAAR